MFRHVGLKIITIYKNIRKMRTIRTFFLKLKNKYDFDVNVWKSVETYRFFPNTNNRSSCER